MTEPAFTLIYTYPWHPKDSSGRPLQFAQPKNPGAPVKMRFSTTPNWAAIKAAHESAALCFRPRR